MYGMRRIFILAWRGKTGACGSKKHEGSLRGLLRSMREEGGRVFAPIPSSL